MSAAASLVLHGFDPLALRAEFPVFAANPGLIFLDTAASAQKPNAVIDGLSDFYRSDYANIHRGVYALSMRASERYDAGRETVRRFLNAADTSEIVFVRGATEAINLVAQTWGERFLREGDEVIISPLEHHSNIVPWQMLRDRLGIVLSVAPLTADGGFDLDGFAAMLSRRTKLVAMTHVANVTGLVLPVAEIISLAHGVGAKVLLDGCQAAPRLNVDVQALDCDFYLFSGHKCYGPTGIGALYAKRDILDTMPPWHGGGDMIDTVTYARTTYQAPPARFEAGTPDIAGVIGLDFALRFIESLGREAIVEHEVALTREAQHRLAALPGVRLIGAGPGCVGVVSFLVDGIHPHDLGTILDKFRIALRTGQHCAQPLMDALGITSTARISFGAYSDVSDIDALIAAIGKAQKMFGVA